MKKLLLLAFTLVFVWSCSTDSDDGDTNLEATLVGTWDMISLTTTTGFDLNDDGTTSADVFNELPCFTSVIVFSADGGYNATSTEIEIVGTSLSDLRADCGPTTIDTGSYVFSGTTLTLDSDTEEATDITATLDGDILTIEENDDDLGPVTAILRRR